MENEVKVEFLSECTVTITLNSSVLFDLMKDTALGASVTHPKSSARCCTTSSIGLRQNS
jgi:hypothetical protein